MKPLPRSLDDISGLRAERWVRESTRGQYDRYGPASQREQQDRFIERAARDREPHRVCAYLEDLARVTHGWYHKCRVLGEPEPIERGRLVLARAARTVLANGLAENASLERGGKALRQFGRALEAITERLARMLVEDGEGASKLVQVSVRGARTRREAVVAARSVANSPLVKTAINGADPNWGRIMMALGKSAARVAADRVAIAIGDEPLVEKGMLWPGARIDRIHEVMGGPSYTIAIDLGSGRGEDSVWTSDLSEEYVRINAKYTT